MRQTDRQIDVTVSNKIQILRGLAIIAVVFIHNTPIGISQVLFRPFLNFCVGLFLFLSGMLSDARKWNPVKRISKVLIPYAIWSLIYIVLSSYKTPFQIPVLYVKHLALANASGVLYYIFVYCEFTLLIPIIDRLANSQYRYFGFAVTPLEIVAMRLILLLFGIEMGENASALRTVSCLGWFTYFYLGYLMGNQQIQIDWSAKKLLVMWVVSIGLQIGEGYWYYCMGDANCGTQLKLTSILSGVLFAVLAYRFVFSNRQYNTAVLKKLGDISFGIYFSHLAVMSVLEIIPFYRQLTPYPVNAIIAITASSLCVFVGQKMLGKYAKYLAL